MNTNTENVNVGHVPTIEEVLTRYQEIAATQRVKTERPCPRTVHNVVEGVRSLCSISEIPLSTPLSELTRRTFDRAIAKMEAHGHSRITIKTLLYAVRGMLARWSLPYYEDDGWTIPKLAYPVFEAHAPRYQRPPRELLTKVKGWYRGLTGERWFAATMMLEFAMRNGDVLRLKPENFVTRREPGDKADRHFLSYTPNKTAHSSRRTVFWPIRDDIWQRIEDCGGLKALDVTEETFQEINRELRALGFNGHKAAYELRKICIDNYYRMLGVEAAVAISGDCIKTILWFYADPSCVNSGLLNIADLL